MEQYAHPNNGLKRLALGQSEYQRLLYAIFAGVLVTLGLPPFPWTGLLVPAGLAWFFIQLPAAEKPARLAWVFGMAHQLTLLHWLFLLIPAKSIPTRALVPIQAIAAIGYVAIFYFCFGWLYGRARNRLWREKSLVLLPVLYIGMELLRDRGELAYPWCLSGSAVVGTPLLSLVRTAGESGVGAALVLSAAAVGALAWSRHVWVYLVRAALVLWILLAAGSLVGGTNSEQSLPVAAVQADVPLADKWDNTKLSATIDPYTKFTGEAATAGAGFIVWAETAVPAYLRYDKELLDWVRGLAIENQVFLYTGFPDANRELDGTLTKFNSSGLFNPQGTLLDRYPKHHLLPIGEAMPFTKYFPGLAKIDVGQAEWTPGPIPNIMTAALEQGDLNFSSLICFESILGRLARDSVGRGSRCLIVLTNDGWFGKTAGPRQHAALAQIRAAECSVPLIRCANNGISLICNERGQVLDSLGLGEDGFVKADIQPGGGQSLFVRWGHWPVVAFILLLTILSLLRPWSKEENADASTP